MKKLGLVWALVVSAACGGSGDSIIPAPTQIVEQLIQDCGSDSINEILDVVDTVNRLLAGQAQANVFVSNGDDAGGTLEFQVDLDGDTMTIEVIGTAAFTDAVGGPITTLNLSGLIGTDGSGLGTQLSSMPDRGQMAISFQPTAAGPPGGTASVTFQSGSASTVDGSLQVNGASCDISISFTGLPASAFAGTVPNATVDTTFSAGSVTGEGTTVFDGTDVARINLSVAGSPTVSFFLNLTTGAVTAVP